MADYLKEKGFAFVRFGQITLDLAKQRFGTVNQEKERIIREEIRKEQGMAAYAIMNMPKFTAGMEQGNVIGDGLISWDEAVYLREQFGQKLIMVCIVAGTSWRYSRLPNRHAEKDAKMRFRAHTVEEAKARDMAQLQNINQGPSIALADYYITNQGTIGELHENIERFLEWAQKQRGLQL